MRRAWLERPRTLRVWRTHKKFIHDDLQSECNCDEQPGRFRKGHRVAGCSRQGCGLCKRHKSNRESLARDYRAALTLREWGTEFGFVIRMPRKPS